MLSLKLLFLKTFFVEWLENDDSEFFKCSNGIKSRPSAKLCSFSLMKEIR